MTFVSYCFDYLNIIGEASYKWCEVLFILYMFEDVCIKAFGKFVNYMFICR